MTTTATGASHSPKRLSGGLLRVIKSTIFSTLFLTQFVFQHNVCVASSQSSTAPSNKLGAHMLRQPESTIAPLYDEVLFECGLNLAPDRLEWRFRPHHTPRTASFSMHNNNDNVNDFIYLSENVSHPFDNNVSIVYFTLTIVSFTVHRVIRIFRPKMVCPNYECM